jgi:hypothetical protein
VFILPFAGSCANSNSAIAFLFHLISYYLDLLEDKNKGTGKVGSIAYKPFSPTNHLIVSVNAMLQILEYFSIS